MYAKAYSAIVAIVWASFATTTANGPSGQPAQSRQDAAALAPRACTNPFPAGPNPSAGAPMAIALDSSRGRIYVVHRARYLDVAASGRLPTDGVSVLNQATGAIIATIPVGRAPEGSHQGIAVDSTRQRAYVTNAGDNTVSIIDTATNTVIATTTVGAEPLGVAADPASGLVYVANGAGRSVTLLDAATGRAVGTINLTGGAYNVAVDPVTRLAYVLVSAAPWTVVAIDGPARAVRSQVELSLLLAGRGIAVDPGSRVYASFSDSGVVAAIDISGARPQEINRIFVSGSYPRQIAVDPTMRVLYATEDANNRVSAFNTSGAAVRTIDVLERPTAIAIDSTARRAYVANTLADSISVLNIDSGATVGTFLLGTNDSGLAVDSTGRRLYATNMATGTVAVIDSQSCNVTANWYSGNGPWSIAVDPNLQQLYTVNIFNRRGTLTTLSTVDGRIKARVDIGLASAARVAVNRTTGIAYATGGTVNANTVTAFDGRTLRTTATITVGASPVGVAIDETANRIYVANQQSGTISVIDGATNAVVATWRPPRGNVWGLVVDPEVGRLLVSVPANVIGDFNGLQVLDSRTGAFIAEVRVQVTLSSETYAGLVAVNTRTHRIYLTETGGGAVGVIDPNGWTLSTVTAGNLPHDVIVDQTTGIAYVANSADGTISTITEAGPPPPPPAPTPPPSPTPPPPPGGTPGPSLNSIDLNGDRAGDVFLYVPSTGSWSIESGNGRGGFTGAGGSWSAGWSVEPADFNGDGRTDFFLHNPTTGVWFKALSNGTGGFTYFTNTWTPGWSTYLIDLDGDGRSDVFLYDVPGGSWFKCLSTGTSGENFSCTAGAWSGGWELYPAEFNGDAKADLFLFSRAAGTWFRAVNDGGTGFTYSSDTWSPFWEIYPGDYNGDGRSDIFLYYAATGEYFFCTNTGSAFSYSGGTMSPGWRVYVGWFDNNNAADLLLYNSQSGSWVEITDSGNFTGAWSAGWQVFTTDLNADSRSDVILYSATTGQWFQAINTAPGAFSYTNGVWSPGLRVIANRPRLP